jgi:hypothetical protein
LQNLASAVFSCWQRVQSMIGCRALCDPQGLTIHGFNHQGRQQFTRKATSAGVNKLTAAAPMAIFVSLVNGYAGRRVGILAKPAS